MMKLATVFLAILISIASCKRNDSKYPYAIKDFSKELKPYLETIVTHGYIGYGISENYIEKHATDKQLDKLSYSEHPVLRALALSILLDRKKGDHYHLIIRHLDDTATISVDQGEFGINYTTVADNIIENSRWKTLEEREKIIDEVLSKHNDLKSAYKILARIKPKEKYYRFIREMAVRDKWDYENENALYALSKFKKREDLALVKKELREKFYYFREYSFDLMREFQDTAFLNILDEWGKRRFANNFCNEERYGDQSEVFVKALAVYQNERVAAIFSRILKWDPKFYCRGDLSYLKDIIYDAIWENQCDAYLRFMQEVRAYIKEKEKRTVKLDPIRYKSKNTDEPTISWWDIEDKRTEP